MKKKHIAKVVYHLMMILDREDRYGINIHRRTPKSIRQSHDKHIKKIQKILRKYKQSDDNNDSFFRLDLAGIAERAYERARSGMGEPQETVGRKESGKG